MSATYTSFDTLTIGQFQSQHGSLGGDLPILAVAPDLRSRSNLAPEPEPKQSPAGHTDAAHQAPPPPVRPLARPEQAAPHEAPPEVAEQVMPTAPTPQPMAATAARPAKTEWEEPGWATLLLDIEATLRPHARTIVLFVLIVLTCLTVVVLRLPPNSPVEIPPTEMVDAPLAPSVLNANNASQQLVGNTAPTPVADSLAPIEPMPVISEPPSTGRAKITAVGPAGLPAAEAWLTGGIASSEQRQPPQAKLQSVATVEAPQDTAQPIRVAERPSYPSTGPFQSWSPAGDLPTPAGAPPVAELMPPSSLQPGQN